MVVNYFLFIKSTFLLLHFAGNTINTPPLSFYARSLYYHNTCLQPHTVITCRGKHIYHCPSTLSMPAPECSSYSTHVLSAIWRPLLSQQASQHTALIHHLSTTHTSSIFLPKVWKFGNSKGVSVRITSRRQSTYDYVVLDGTIVWVRLFVNATFLIASDALWSHHSGRQEGWTVLQRLVRISAL